jgi:hypothetical protein
MIMKKLLTLLLLATLFVSCSSDDDNEPRKIDITSIAIEPIDKDLYVGDEYQLKAKYSPENAETPNYTWKSSNTDIASVSDKGILTAKAEGNVTISASYGEISNSINLKIFNTLFGYKFGSSKEEINPEVKISNDFAYNWASTNGYEPPMRAFKFQSNKLTSVWSCYGTGKIAFTYFVKEVEALNPPQKITSNTDNEFGRTTLEQDSLSWKYHNYNILIRNGEILINDKQEPMIIIEYKQAQ